VERVLVTGATTWEGAELVHRLGRRSNVEVVGDDDGSSEDALEFAAWVIEQQPTVVVHLDTCSTTAASFESLVAALARLPALRLLVVRSDLAVHGAGPRMPSIIGTETISPGPPTPYGRALRELERGVLSFAHERPDISVTILRFAPILRPDTPISRFLAEPPVPTVLGFDPRLQFVHRHDAIGALQHAVYGGVHGVFDVTAPGQMYLSAVLRTGRVPSRPLPGRIFRSVVGARLPPHLIELLRHGRVVEPTTFDFGPMRDCRATVIDFYRRQG
jgi:nucleoside-diphosphate-sugar epimerase